MLSKSTELFLLHILKSRVRNVAKEHTKNSRYIEEKADKLQKGDKKKFQSLIVCKLKLTKIVNTYSLFNNP